jgi:hypothetical protein
MWTKRVTSHSSEFPNRADVIRHLLQQLVDRRMVGSWAHIELVEESGWFFNLLSGKAPWVEVAMADDGFELSLGFRKNQSAELAQFPKSWQEAGKRLWKVPAIEFSMLCDWIDSSFAKICSKSPARKLSGWIEG